MTDTGKSHRLFFALWPSNEVRTQIVKAFMRTPQQARHGRLMDPANLHMTLHFIGNVGDQQKDCLDQQARTVTGEACTLRLDHFGHFYRARVFWLGCRELPEQIKTLHQNLGHALQSCGYQMERRPYAPHVTLMRKLNRPGEIVEPQPIDWPINEFVLVESVPKRDGVEYRVVERYGMSG